jgi:hypothetical protein
MAIHCVHLEQIIDNYMKMFEVLNITFKALQIPLNSIDLSDSN